MAPRAPLHVLAYDEHCGPCSRFKAAVELLDARGRIRFVPLEAAEGSGLMAGVPQSRRYSSFHLFSRAPGASSWDARSGAEALLPLARALSPSGVASRMAERAPGVEAAASFVYSALSRLHGRCPVRVGAGVARPEGPLDTSGWR